AEHHLLAARAERIGELVGAFDLRTHRADADDVARRVEIDVLDELVDDADVPVLRRQRLERRHREPAGPVARGLDQLAATKTVRRRYEQKRRHDFEASIAWGIVSRTVLERIEQLMALATSPNEHEARNAALLAVQLMRKHK